jgi:hypothetical protein
LRGKGRAVGEGIGDGARSVGPAVEIDHDRAFGAGVGVGGPDVEEQAVFGLRFRAAAALRGTPA